MLPGLPVLRDTGLKFTSACGHNEDSAVSLGRSGDHIFYEISMARGIDDSNVVLVCLEFHQLDVDSDATLAFRFQLVQDPSILEGAL